MDQAMHSEAKREGDPQGPTAAENLGETLKEQLVLLTLCSLTLLQELSSCFLTVFPAVRRARKSLKSNFLPK